MLKANSIISEGIICNPSQDEVCIPRESLKTKEIKRVIPFSQLLAPLAANINKISILYTFSVLRLLSATHKCSSHSNPFRLPSTM